MAPWPTGIGQQSVTHHPEMIEVHVGGLDRRFSTVRERTVDAVASVETQPCTAYLKINPIPTAAARRMDIVPRPNLT